MTMRGNDDLPLEVSSSLVDRVLDALRLNGCRVVQQRADSHRCTCPTHRDTRPSLVVTARDGRVLVRCFAGCKTSDVLAAIGLRFADLFDAGSVRRGGRVQIVEKYPYADLRGEIVAEKVRFVPKSFRWRRPDATMRGGWRWGLDAAPLPLYRWPELIDAADVLLVEGEKAVDLLTAHGFTATCPPVGASTWHERWTVQLDAAGCARLIVLPDADREGAAHGQRVAAACFGLMRVKVVDLPDLPAKGDVVDFFSAGNTAVDLRRLIEAAPDWSPDAIAREREKRKRDQTRERVRRHRERQRQAFGRAADAGDDMPVPLREVTA